MKKIGKLLACMVILTILIASFAGCGSAPASSGGTTAEVQKGDEPKKDEPTQVKKDEIVTIKWSTWGNPGELSRFKEFTEDFNQKNSNIKAELVPIPNDGYEQKVLTSLAAGTAPDIFYSGDGSIQKFVRDNRLLELTNMMVESSTMKPDSIYENLYGAAKQGDKIYGVTVDCNPMVIYYNINMLKDLGIKNPQEYYDEGKWNWDAFTEIARKSRGAGKHGFILNNWWGPVSLFSNSDIIGYFGEDGKTITIDSPEKVEGIRFMSSLIKEKAVTYQGALPKGQGDDAMFMSGQVAMATAGRWWVPMFKKITAFQWDIISYPSNLDGKEPVVGIPTAYLVINKDTKNAQAAFTFLEQFCNKDGQIFRLKDGGNAVPSYKDPESDKVVEEGNVPPHAKFLLDARASGRVVSLGAQMYPEADKAINDTLDLVWLGKLDVEAAVKQAKEKAEAEIAKTNK
jgi:multiple sugar transport system substrate-binding protein